MLNVASVLNMTVTNTITNAITKLNFACLLKQHYLKDVLEATYTVKIRTIVIPPDTRVRVPNWSS